MLLFSQMQLESLRSIRVGISIRFEWYESFINPEMLTP